MNTAHAIPSDVAFSASVKAVQTRLGSRRAYAQMEQGRGWRTALDAPLRAFVEAQTSVFLATANAAGQPYIQHRGGAAGFLKVLRSDQIGFADYSGNRQYISVGNLSENPKVHLFLIDYAARQRVKIWGTARVVEDDADLVAQLAPADGGPRVERAIVIDIAAVDINCPKHIPQRFEAADVAAAVEAYEERIRALEAEVAALRARDRAAQ